MKRIAPLVIILAILGCDSDPTSGPTPDSIAGTYTAISLQTPSADILAQGASLTLILRSDRTVDGNLTIPEEAGGPLSESMAGTYTLAGNALRFTQTADTFVRDAEWTINGGELRGDWDGNVTATLEKQ